ncbi:hypothetical protein N0V82_005815 [Gnomoniopsis sp. IMI 355080]|nr:hypothetical protein N0V82_005815 [Gnomoniopsis sp. IMI 355080]
MLNPTPSALIFIRLCVFGIQYAPFLYILLPPPLSIIALVTELLYYLFIYRRFQARLAEPAQHPPDTREEREALFNRCLANIPDPEKYLSLWALGADKSQINRDNAREFMRWAFADRSDAGSPEIESELNDCLAKTEHLLGRPLPDGRGSAVPMRLTYDPVHTRYRTFLWYLTVGIVDSATHVRMLWSGFKFHAASLLTNLIHVFPPRPLVSLDRLSRKSASAELNHWYRPPIATQRPTLPIVFLHGIGIGLYPYVHFLSDLPPTSPVLAVEVLPICMRLTRTNILARPDFLRHLKDILRQHNIDRFVLIGHSYGTALASHVLKDPELSLRVEGVVLVDPVSLLLHLPDVAYNFTRRMPTTANEWQLWYLASMDPGIALVLGRHFFWRENIIWKDELVTKGDSKRNAAVCLSSRDLIVDTITLARYLIHEEGLTELGQHQSLADDEKLATALDQGSTVTHSGLEMLWFKMDHAQAFDKRLDYLRIIDVVQRFIVYPEAGR